MKQAIHKFTHVAGTVSKAGLVIIASAALYSITTTLVIQKKPVEALPLVSKVALGYHAPAKVTAAIKLSDNKKPRSDNDSWTYNFAKYADGSPSLKDWNFENGNAISDYNGELQTYTSRKENVRIEGGKLVIEARPENRNGKTYSSARINTLGTFDFTYGTMEVDMKVPKGRGTWPAAWLLPRDNKYHAADFGIGARDKFGWALNGEIDFAESVGFIPNQTIPAIHSYNEVKRAPTYTPGFVPNQASEFHRYGVIKTPDTITFTVDGVPYATRHKKSANPLEWPYDQPYYLVLNLAVGGKWAGQKGIDTSSAPWQMQIRSISYTPMASNQK